MSDVRWRDSRIVPVILRRGTIRSDSLGNACSSVAVSDHLSKCRQHRLGLGIDRLVRAFQAFDRDCPRGRQGAIGDNEIENRVVIEDERALFIDRKVFNPVFVKHAFQINRHTEVSLACWWIIGWHNVLFV